MTNAEFRSHLLKLDACSEALDWVDEHPKLSPAQLWATCSRADWLLWLAGRVGVDRKTLVSAAADCAETASGHKDCPEVVECIRVTRLWVIDEASLDTAVYAAAAARGPAYDTAAADADLATTVRKHIKWVGVERAMKPKRKGREGTK